jgi:tetratricopeptide (TPR) repeat protein
MVEGFRPDVNIANLQLLNTDWYIKQLRDRKPPVPISLTDPEIERLRPMALKGGGVAWKKDLAIQHIIQETNWKRPIYFAVTVPHEAWQPYAEYLEMQGMARKLITKKGQYQTNEFLLRRNFDDIFEFRGVIGPDGMRDESTFKSAYTAGMFQNFAVASMELARLSALRKDFDEALKWTRLTQQLKPDFDFPDRVLGLYLARTGQVEAGIEHYERVIREQPERAEFWVGLARIYSENEEPDKAIATLRRGAQVSPGTRDIYANGFYTSARAGRVDDARFFVEAWLNRHPGDKEFRQLLENFDKVLFEEFGIGEPPDTSGRAGQK